MSQTTNANVTGLEMCPIRGSSGGCQSFGPWGACGRRLSMRQRDLDRMYLVSSADVCRKTGGGGLSRSKLAGALVLGCARGDIRGLPPRSFKVTIIGNIYEIIQHLRPRWSVFSNKPAFRGRKTSLQPDIHIRDGPRKSHGSTGHETHDRKSHERLESRADDSEVLATGIYREQSCVGE